MQTLRTFRTLAIVAVLAFSAAGCGGSKASSQGHSQISVAVAHDTKAGCVIAPFDYRIELGERTNWRVDVQVRRDYLCPASRLSVVPERVDGSSVANIDISQFNDDDYHTFRLIVAPGVFRFLIDGKPTQATITVTQQAATTVAPQTGPGNVNGGGGPVIPGQAN